MGYNSWNDLECKTSEAQLKAIADRIKELGLLAAGYEYLVVDDCWMLERDANSQRLVEDKKAWPSGMKAFGRYLHEKGFKYGIYTDRGVKTCVGRPASRGREAIDGKLFAEWDVDFVKNDGCGDPECGDVMQGYPQSGSCPDTGKRAAVEKYSLMAKAFNASGRPIVHSICGWQPWFAPVGRRIGHMWRVTADVRDFKGVYEAARVMEKLRRYHGAHGWNDPDMLIGSSEGASLVLTPEQSRAQFSLWAVMSAPLMIGASIMKMSAYDVETYSNVDAIRIDQDASGDAGEVVYSSCPEYPSFKGGVKPDGTPIFDVQWPGGQVFCGAEFASSCAACANNGRDSCKGSCTFIAKGEAGCFPQKATNASGSGEGKKNQVKCGNHYANDCSKCPQGHGRPWCNDDCVWRDEGKCIAKRFEDGWYPWTLGMYQNKEKMQCQLVWTKKLSTGSVALAAVNFASQSAKVVLELKKLKLKWKKTKDAYARDLWKGSSKAVNRTLRLNLEANGGHALLELHDPDSDIAAAEVALSPAPTPPPSPPPPALALATPHVSRSTADKQQSPLGALHEESMRALLARAPRKTLEQLVAKSVSRGIAVTLSDVLDEWPAANDQEYTNMLTSSQILLALASSVILVFLLIIRRRQRLHWQ